MVEERLIVTFPSTHVALRAERVAQEAGVKIKMIPVPRKISSDCNMGMEASIEQRDALEALFAEKDIECNFVTWEAS